jgi:hypothetical protein
VHATKKNKIGAVKFLFIHSVSQKIKSWTGILDPGAMLSLFCYRQSIFYHFGLVL